ncbi:amino acid adenylation domain-containing protein [Streptomyces dangxiongensis]|uniref:amino acid adenylation domain-containing protein n=1 Tax=Streptomyces dangxiongensis TaxID=1442032 RepID=UPI0013CEC6E7|nr:amino acid adenylation domain-containing protein [Streptomyces dangxiongensis]
MSVPISAPSSLPGLFREVARLHPGRTAVAQGERRLTYAELDRESDGLARVLRQRGVAPGDLVGIVNERTAAFPVGVLAVLKAGGTYVPLDPAYPTERLLHMVRDAAVGLVVGDASALPEQVARDLTAVGLGERAPADEDEAAPGPEDAAYVIYTSGSTGLPKGCVVTHGNVLSLIRGALPLFAFGPDDRWSLFHSTSFDLSVWEMWGAWAGAATVVIVDQEAAQEPARLLRFLQDEAVTVLNMVPSVFQHLVHAHADAGAPELPLLYVVFGGEAAQIDVVRAFVRGLGAPPRMVNMYGITETTVHATFKEFTPEELAGTGPATIGTALPHLRIDLRDDDGKLVPEGEPGEIWVYGAGVAHGYLNRPELTAARFTAAAGDPAEETGYRSGDLARLLPDGEMEYLGRNDQQVKLRGFRIELGEIESVLRAHPEVREAAVVVEGTDTDTRRLLALLVPARPGTRLDPAGLRAHAATRLTTYMVPHRFEVVGGLPLTPSGKLDRQLLQKAVDQRAAARTGHRA